MRNRFVQFLFFFCLALITVPANSIVTPSIPSSVTAFEAIYNRSASMKMKDIQRLIGRKLTIKERIGFWLVKQKTKHEWKNAFRNKVQGEQEQGMPFKGTRYSDSNPGQGALIIGIAALALLIISFFVPYVILGSFVASIFAIVMGSTTFKQDRTNKKAHAAKLLGWITLGLIALFILAASIALASW